jgi:uncharacterized protein
MKIFAISDIHNERSHFEAASELIASSDLVVVSGDLTNRGDRKSAEEILSSIVKYNTSILAVHGNWDRLEVAALLEDRGYSLHGRGRVIQGIGFFGVGGSSETPFKTACEYSEDEIRDFMAAGYRDLSGAEKTVLVSHAPPRNIRDKTFLGLHGGSISVSEFIKENHIDLCLAGHIHEAHGTERLNGCMVVNSGSFRKGRYSLININGSIAAEQEKLQS